MSDELKEILEYLKNDFYAYGDTYIEEKCKIVTKNENHQLLDYITNLQQQLEIKNKGFKATVEELCETSEKLEQLQQENERLKEENKRIFSKVNDDELLISNAMNYAEAQDYKSRCEKAIKHIKEHTENIDRGRYYEDYVETYDLLNILNGGGEE